MYFLSAIFIHYYKKNVVGFTWYCRKENTIGDIVDQSDAETYGVRPEHIKFSSDKGKIKCTLRHLENLGADTLYYMQSEDDQQITVRVEGMGYHQKGEILYLDFDESNVHKFKDGKRINGN